MAAAATMNAFFNDLHGFATALERDAIALRSNIEEPVHHHIEENGVDGEVFATLREMTSEAENLRLAFETLCNDEEHKQPLETILDEYEGLIGNMSDRIINIEDELSQYGYIKLPYDNDEAEEPENDAASQAQGDDAGHGVVEDAPDDDEEDLLDSSTASTAGTAESDQEKVTEDDQCNATPAKLLARQPLEAGTPKTPSLEDFGISVTTMHALRGDDYKQGTSQQWAADESTKQATSDSPLDVSSYGIKSVPVLDVTQEAQDIHRQTNGGSGGDCDAAKEEDEEFTMPTIQLSAWSVAALDSKKEPVTPPEVGQVPEESTPIGATPPVAPAAIPSNAEAQPPSHPGREIQPAEYAALSGYLQDQVPLDFLNEILGALLECVNMTGMPIEEVTLTESQLSDDLGLNEKAKAVLLMFIKLKRLRARGVNAAGEKTFSFVSA